MSAISNNNIARAIYEVSKASAGHSIYPKIIEFLARKKMLSKSAEVLKHLNKIINEEEGRIAVKVWSAEKLTEHTKKEIKHAVSKRYGNKEVVLEENLNEGLLGGFRIEVNDEVIDLTLKNRIEKLQEHLTDSMQ
jgi:F-type H+-transporting ATPase subunit delta